MDDKEKLLSDLKNVVLNFDIDQARDVARNAMLKGLDPIEASNALTDAIRIIGDLFSKGDLFLPDLVCAAEVLKKALPEITSTLESKGIKKQSLAKIVIGTVYGDIHSIGKSMVATLLFAAGFEVIDLGINVKSEEFLKAIKEYRPHVLAMSALLTTTAMEQKNVIEGLKKENLREGLKVIVGGSPINQEFSDQIGADGYGATAPDAVKLVKKLLEIK